MKLRVKFRKFGPIRFIGHLDVMRFFQKVNRRAELDVCYSNGFSPHQIMSFAAPLSVGLESNGEYMDMEVFSITSSEDYKNRMNESSVPGIEIVSVKVLPDNSENAMASVAAAAYTVVWKPGYPVQFDLQEGLDRIMSQDQILMVKQTKKSEREIDLKAGIYEIKAIENGYYMVIDASSAGNIKPKYIVDAIMKQYQLQLDENAIHVIREDTFMSITENEETKLVPLDYEAYLV